MKEILLIVSLYAALCPFVGIKLFSNTNRLGGLFRIVLSVDVFLVFASTTLPVWLDYFNLSVALTEFQMDLIRTGICLVAAGGTHYFLHHVRKI